MGSGKMKKATTKGGSKNRSSKSFLPFDEYLKPIIGIVIAYIGYQVFRDMNAKEIVRIDISSSELELREVLFGENVSTGNTNYAVLCYSENADYPISSVFQDSANDGSAPAEFRLLDCDSPVSFSKESPFSKEQKTITERFQFNNKPRPIVFVSGSIGEPKLVPSKYFKSGGMLTKAIKNMLEPRVEKIETTKDLKKKCLEKDTCGLLLKGSKTSSKDVKDAIQKLLVEHHRKVTFAAVDSSVLYVKGIEAEFLSELVPGEPRFIVLKKRSGITAAPLTDDVVGYDEMSNLIESVLSDSAELQKVWTIPTVRIRSKKLEKEDYEIRLRRLNRDQEENEQNNKADIDMGQNSEERSASSLPSSSSLPSMSSPTLMSKKGLQTRPADLPPPKPFSAFNGDTTVTISVSSPKVTEVDVVVRPASILQMGKNKVKTFASDLAVLPGMVPRTVVAEMLTLLRGNEDATKANGHTTIKLDAEPDSVDGMTSQEMFLDNDSLRNNRPSKEGGFEQENMEERRELRAQLRQLTDPYVEKITNFLHKWYGADKCNKGNGRTCTACYSLIRRYRAGERQSHAPHNDKHSYITVVVSLTDYGKEYNGGLYVSTKNSERNYVQLDRGDAVIHQGDLHHGVKVLDHRDDGMPSERWSWIMWIRDSDTCEDHEAEWYEKCAEEGNPTCMYLKATHLNNAVDVVNWNQKASDAGHSQASVKLGYAYLKVLPSHLEFDIEKAENLFTEAIKSSNEPDGHYGLAQVLLAKVSMNIMNSSNKQQASKEALASPMIAEVVTHLEEAVKSGHPFAMFNLGICHLYGYCQKDGRRDPDLAAEWFEASGLPEGFFAKSLHAGSVGRKEEAEMWLQRAKLLGYGSQWRQPARERTGSGGSSGAKLNMKWFKLPTGELPEQF